MADYQSLANMNTFAPMQNALSGLGESAKMGYQVKRQNMLDQVSLAQLGEVKRKSEMERFQVAGKYAKMILGLPEEQRPQAYEAATQQLERIFGKSDQPIPPYDPEKVEMIAKAYDQINPPEYDIKDGQYVPKDPAAGVPAKPIPGFVTPRTIDKTIDLGDKQRVVYSDGTTEDMPKAARPDTVLRLDRGGSGGEEEPISFTPDAVDNAAYRYNMDGTLPPMGMGKAGVRARSQILNRAAEIAAKEGVGGEEQRVRHFTNKAIAGSIQQQEKQLGSMGSFVKNLDAQVDRVGELAKEIKTFDTRLLNVPLRTIRGRIAGNANQAKYDMYLTEIESEIGKLATGSTASVAELSASAQEKWAKIHDKNLSINDMLELLKETKQAGHLRVKSVEDNLKETRSKLTKKPSDPSKLPEPQQQPKQPTVSNW